MTKQTKEDEIVEELIRGFEKEFHFGGHLLAPALRVLLDKAILSERQRILEIIADRKERALRDWEETRRIAGHSAYGTGVDWGMAEMCEYLTEDINEEF